MKRLVRLSAIDIEKMENEYRRMIEQSHKNFFNNKENVKYELKEHTNNDAKTFLINPQNLVEYDNNQLDTAPRPGIPGPWSSSLRWIGR